MTELLVLADARNEIANYLSAVITVYVILIIAYILSSLFFSFGGRVPYSRWSSAILGFLRDVCEPYLACSGASSRRSARSTSARSSRSSCCRSSAASSSGSSAGSGDAPAGRGRAPRSSRR